MVKRTGCFDEGPKKVRWDRMFKASNTGDINKTSYWWIAVLILVLFFGWDYFTKMFKKRKKMNNVLLPVFYLSPVQWFAEFLDENNNVVFEEWENFPKQTYRNRTEIYGANGKLALIIPTSIPEADCIKKRKFLMPRIGKTTLEVN